MNNQSSMPEMMQTYPQAAVKPVMENAMTYRAIYPEVYYKLKPYISMTCDLIFSYGMMPTQQQLEEMSDGIYNDFCTMYPDMADYMSKSGEKDDPPGDPPPFRGGFRGGEEFREGFRPGFGFGRFRRRGLGRDFIDALLLSELFGRGGFVF
jgi:hypothetical protein